jgi:hypothetical protein
MYGGGPGDLRSKDATDGACCTVAMVKAVLFSIHTIDGLYESFDLKPLQLLDFACVGKDEFQQV